MNLLRSEELRKKKADFNLREELRKKKVDFNLREEIQLVDEREAQEEFDLSLIGSKRSRVLGPMNRMLDQEKLKQSTLNEGESKVWKEHAQFYVT